MACFVVWSLIASITIVSLTNLIAPLRMTPENEILGSDFVEHDLVYDINPLLPIEKNKGSNDSFENMHNGERPKMVSNYKLMSD